MIHGKVAEHAGLNLYFLRERLPFHLVSRLEFVAFHDVLALKHPDAGLIKVAVEDDRGRLFRVQAAAFSLGNPLVAVAVAVEMYRTAGADILTNHVENGRKLVLALRNECVYPTLKVGQRFGSGRV